MVDERYLRQITLPNWRQEMLSRSRALVVGCGRVGAAVATGAAMLGFGSITVMDREGGDGEADSILCGGETGTPRARRLEAALKVINPGVRAAGVAADLVSDVQLEAMPKPDVLFVTSDIESDFEICRDYAKEAGVPLVLARGSGGSGLCAVMMNDIDAEDDHEDLYLPACGEASGAVACVIGGLALNEARAMFISLTAYDCPTEEVVRYSPDTLGRFGDPAPNPATGRRRGGKVALVGAGGLGSWFAVAALDDDAVPFEEIDVFDHDTVAIHNLNRQVLYARGVGRPKVDVFGEEVRRMRPDIRVNPIAERMTPKHFTDRPAPDAVVSAVDNFTTRWMLQNECGRAHIPLLNGGTSALHAEVMTYYEGLSACLRCAADIERHAAAESEQPASCSASPEPSTVIANMIGGGLLAGELGNALADPPNVSRATLVFDALADCRVGLRSARTPCSCWQATEAEERR